MHFIPSQESHLTPWNPPKTFREEFFMREILPTALPVGEDQAVLFSFFEKESQETRESKMTFISQSREGVKSQILSLPKKREDLFTEGGRTLFFEGEEVLKETGSRITLSSLPFSVERVIVGGIYSHNALRGWVEFYNPDEKIRDLFITRLLELELQFNRTSFLNGTIKSLLSLLVMHDPSESLEHAERVEKYACELYEIWAKQEGVPERERREKKEILSIAALLHDIGKSGISSSLLTQKGSLGADAIKEIQRHPVLAAIILEEQNDLFDEEIIEVVLRHHEFYNGRGYPGPVDLKSLNSLHWTARGKSLGLKGEEIPLLAKILTIADAFDSLTRERSYRSSKTKEEAFEVIEKGGSGQFDPLLVDLFLAQQKDTPK